MKLGWFTLAVGFCIAAIILFPWFLRTPYDLIGVMGAMTLLLVIVGQRVVGRPLGVLMSDRNVMSLTRFQSIVWTVIVLALFTTIVIGRVSAKQPLGDFMSGDALRPDLLALMGISYASAVGAGLVSSNKANKSADPSATQQMVANNGPVADQPQGVLYRNKSSRDAAITDIFEGDEVADAHLVDTAKVQMFFFTIVGAVIFLSQAFGQLKSIATATIPPISQNLIALMGISHAAYLGGKTVTKTPEVQPGVQPQASAAVVTIPPPQSPSVVTSTQPGVAPTITAR